ncbi:hypothetical protein AB837_00289 [bacterium AB1]|nr:hypothetical protein AB837_00289 [bacterium AB1]
MQNNKHNKSFLHVGFDCEFSDNKIICWSLYIYETKQVHFFTERKTLKETIKIIDVSLNKYTIVFVGHFNIAEIITLGWYEEIKLLSKDVVVHDKKNIILSSGSIQFYDTKILTNLSLQALVSETIDPNWKKTLTKDELKNIEQTWENNPEKIKEYNIDDSKQTILAFIAIKEYLEKFNISIYQNNIQNILKSLLFQNIDFDFQTHLCKNSFDDQFPKTTRKEIFNLKIKTDNVKKNKNKIYVFYLKKEYLHAISYMYLKNTLFNSYVLTTTNWSNHVNKPSMYLVEFEYYNYVQVPIIPVLSHDNTYIYPLKGCGYISNIELKLLLKNNDLKHFKILKCFYLPEKESNSSSLSFSNKLVEITQNSSNQIEKIFNNILGTYIHNAISNNNKETLCYYTLKNINANSPNLFNDFISSICYSYTRSIVNSVMVYISKNTKYNLILCDDNKVVFETQNDESIYFDGFINSINKFSNNQFMKTIAHHNFVLKNMGDNICIINKYLYKIYSDSVNSFTSANWNFKVNYINILSPQYITKKIFPNLNQCIEDKFITYKLITYQNQIYLNLVEERKISANGILLPFENIQEHKKYTHIYNLYKKNNIIIYSEKELLKLCKFIQKNILYKKYYQYIACFVLFPISFLFYKYSRYYLLN